MFFDTQQATSKDWLTQNEGFIFYSKFHGEVGTTSIHGAPLDLMVISTDIFSYLNRTPNIKIDKKLDILKREFVGWDTLSDEALRKFEADL